MEKPNRIFQLRKHIGLNQADFGKRIGVTRSAICNYENGSRSISEQVILAICREFNVSEAWLRTGDGEMFALAPDGDLEALKREYKLSPGMYTLIKRLLALKPENQRVAVDLAVKIADALNGITTGQTVADAGGQERTELDLVAKIAELERQNQELADKVAAMEEEDALLGATDGFSISHTESAGSLSQRAKK